VSLVRFWLLAFLTLLAPWVLLAAMAFGIYEALS
jgi:hypothetical protein